MTHRAGLDQQSVIQAAGELADNKSLEAVTLATLAAKLGIRTPTLYHYVDGLDGLRRDLALSGARQLARELGQAIMGLSGSDALEAIAVAYWDFARAHPGLYSALQRAADLEDKELQQAQSEVVIVTMRAVAPGSSSNLEQNDAVHTVRLLRSLLHGFVSLEGSGGFGLPQDSNETFRRLVQVMISIVEEGKRK